MLKKNNEDTIVAITTPPGDSSTGSIRISGNQSLRILKQIFNGNKAKQYKPRTAYLGWIKDHNSNEVDQAIAIYYKSPKSYTGEDICEINAHGNSFLLNKIVGLIIKKGARLASAGEFTKRAFINGKINLSQAESVIDIIKAKSERFAQNAITGIKGKLAEKVEKSRSRLMEALSLVEASIDFPDDMEANCLKKAQKEIIKEIAWLSSIIEKYEDGRIVREGIRVAIVGRTNVGKSSLLNAMLKEDRAIINKEHGTTRDTIEEQLLIGGYLINIIDTAGIRKHKSDAEKIGIEKTKQSIENADLVLIVLDASKKPSSWDRMLIKKTSGKKRIVLLNKSDKRICVDNLKLIKNDKIRQSLKISAKNHIGIKEAEAMIVKMFIGKKRSEKDGYIVANKRQLEAICRAKDALLRAADTYRRGFEADLVAIDLRDAIRCLGEILGKSISDEVIEKIFADFCVGK